MRSKLILSVLAISLLTAIPAVAQVVGDPPDGQRVIEPPRTKRERDLGLEGKPRGQPELEAPFDDGRTISPDLDEDESDSDAPPPRARPMLP